ncbi:MAG TPA: YIP1 family protein [Pyrinomonadaceae bacterium]|nr:YIP1 family protein [Pyrinomonadaceae bacterium]
MSANEPNFQPPPPPVKPPAETKPPRPVKVRPFAIGSFVLGLIVLGLSIAGLIPGGYTTAAALCFAGVLLFALSFIRLPDVPAKEPPLPFFDKVSGIFFEPSRVFRNLREHPSWVGAFLIIAVLSAIYTFCFVQRITPERMVEHNTQKLSEMQPPFRPPDEEIERQKVAGLTALKNPASRAAGVLSSFVGIFVLGVFVAAVSMLGMLVFGGRINYWQSLAVVFYSWLPVAAILRILGLVILYIKSPEDLHPILNAETTLQDNLGILFSPADHPILFVLASFIGLTSFYGLWLRAKGLHLGATRGSSGAGWGVAITLWLLALLFVTALTALFPGFIS